MPLPKQYQILRNALNSPKSRLETFEDDSTDCFSRATAHKTNGLTYAQACELYHKDRELYEQIFHDSCWD